MLCLRAPQRAERLCPAHPKLLLFVSAGPAYPLLAGACEGLHLLLQSYEDPDTLSLEAAVELLAAKAESPTRKGGKRSQNREVPGESHTLALSMVSVFVAQPPAPLQRLLKAAIQGDNKRKSQQNRGRAGRLAQRPRGLQEAMARLPLRKRAKRQHWEQQQRGLEESAGRCKRLRKNLHSDQIPGGQRKPL